VKILALDLATTIGWAFWAPGRVPVHGTRTLPSCDVGPFLDKFERFLSDKITDHSPDLAVIEYPAMPFGKSSVAGCIKLYSLYGLAEQICWRRDVKTLAPRRQEAVKHFAGIGLRHPTVKAAIIARCSDLGMKTSDDNDADALALLSLGAHQNGLQVDWPVNLEMTA